MNWLYVTAAHHEHARQVALALREDGALGAWLTGPLVTRHSILACLPGFQRRVLDEDLPIHPFYLWEGLRAVAAKCGMQAWADACWERGEWQIDRAARRKLEEHDGVMGFEHGCCLSIETANRLGKRSAVWFASPHHAIRKRWLKDAAARWPEWAHGIDRSAPRDERRDREIQLAQCILSNSDFTRDSLVSAGVSPSKIRAIPLGLPPPVDAQKRPVSDVLCVLYVGHVTLHKGVPYLLEAFRNLEGARLDLYGQIFTGTKHSSDRIHFHGAVDRDVLRNIYAQADVLVFPSLGDGFGQVVGEALAHGLPVICSTNAGAAQFIRDGENGFRVSPADSEAIRAAIQRCLDDREGLEKMRGEARATAARWSWKDFRRATREALHHFEWR